VVLGAADGRPLDREEFARRYGPPIRAYLGARWPSSNPRGEIDDAVQDVFLECFKEGGALARVERDRPGGFRAFLYGVVRNVARRVEGAHQDARLPSGFDPASGEEPASRAFDRAWARGLMRQATALQKERARAGGEAAQRRVELLELRFSEGLPIRSIAERWGMKATQVQYEYTCARNEFQAALVDVVRQHDPDGDPATESARLLGLL
jgi:RNA polymerase sigma-70 factor (ECF subfamily)